MNCFFLLALFFSSSAFHSLRERVLQLVHGSRSAGSLRAVQAAQFARLM